MGIIRVTIKQRNLALYPPSPPSGIGGERAKTMREGRRKVVQRRQYQQRREDAENGAGRFLELGVATSFRCDKSGKSGNTRKRPHCQTESLPPSFLPCVMNEHSGSNGIDTDGGGGANNIRASPENLCNWVSLFVSENLSRNGVSRWRREIFLGWFGIRSVENCLIISNWRLQHKLGGGRRRGRGRPMWSDQRTSEDEIPR